MDRINWSKYKREYVYKEKENYLFKPQLDKLVSLVAEISEDNDTHANKVIGINGERGSGKSSLLHTFKHYIENYDSEKNARYYVLKPIDPNYLDSKMGLLEMVLTYLYDAVDEKLKDQREKGYDVTTAKQLRDDIIKQIAFQANLRQDESFRDRSVPSDLINEFRNRINFSEAYNQLFKRCWALLKEKSCENYQPGNMIILIDDIDIVDNSIIYHMLEDVKRVLGKNVTTVLTYRKEQLHNSLYDVKIQENKNLIAEKLINNKEIIKQGDTFLEKLVIKNHVIEMNESEYLIKKKLNEVFVHQVDLDYLKDKGFNENLSIIKTIYTAIEKGILIDIEGRDSTERELFESQFTLRRIMQIFEVIVGDFKDVKSTVFNVEHLKHNLKIFKDYLLDEAPLLLTKLELSSLKMWLNSDAINKNYIIYREIIQNQKFHIEGSLKLEVVQNYNICLGDVIHLLETSAISKNFKYIIKIMYSIELLGALINEIYLFKGNEVYLKGMSYKDASIHDSNIYFNSDEAPLENAYWQTEYYHLTRYKIMPDDFLRMPDSDGSNTVTSWVMQYSGIENEDPIMYRALDKILFTTIGATGEVVSKIRHKGQGVVDYLTNYRYYDFYKPRFNKNSKFSSDIYNVDQRDSIVKKRNYYYDPFTILVKEQYLSQITKGISTYLFYSLFDLEMLLHTAFLTIVEEKNKSQNFIENKINLRIIYKTEKIIKKLNKNKNRLGRLLVNSEAVVTYTSEDIEIFKCDFNNTFQQVTLNIELIHDSINKVTKALKQLDNTMKNRYVVSNMKNPKVENTIHEITEILLDLSRNINRERSRKELIVISRNVNALANNLYSDIEDLKKVNNLKGQKLLSDITRKLDQFLSSLFVIYEFNEPNNLNYKDLEVLHTRAEEVEQAIYNYCAIQRNNYRTNN